MEAEAHALGSFDFDGVVELHSYMLTAAGRAPRSIGGQAPDHASPRGGKRRGLVVRQ